MMPVAIRSRVSLATGWTSSRRGRGRRVISAVHGAERSRFGPHLRSVVLTKHGPPEVLQVQERPDPEPGAGEVLVDVQAAGINFADLMARVGPLPRRPEAAARRGLRGGGHGEPLGDGVDGLRWATG